MDDDLKLGKVVRVKGSQLIGVVSCEQFYNQFKNCYCIKFIWVNSGEINEMEIPVKCVELYEE